MFPSRWLGVPKSFHRSGIMESLVFSILTCPLCNEQCLLWRSVEYSPFILMINQHHSEWTLNRLIWAIKKNMDNRPIWLWIYNMVVDTCWLWTISWDTQVANVGWYSVRGCWDPASRIGFTCREPGGMRTSMCTSGGRATCKVVDASFFFVDLQRPIVIVTVLKVNRLSGYWPLLCMWWAETS